MSCKAATREKTLLLLICFAAVIGLILLAVLSLGRQLDANSSTLCGVIVTGLVAFSKDAVQTVRSFWTDDRFGKMSDQLAQSGPPISAENPLPTTITNSAADAVPVTDTKGEP